MRASRAACVISSAVARGAVLLVEHVVGGLDVALERERLVLHDAHVEAVGLQQVVDPLPAGAVHEPSVDEDDVAHFGHGDLPFGWSAWDEVDVWSSATVAAFRHGRVRLTTTLLGPRVRT